MAVSAARVTDMRSVDHGWVCDGKLNDPEFGTRMKGGGVHADHVSRLLGLACGRAGIERGRFPKLSAASLRRDR